MVDNLKTVTARIYEFRQFKSCQITAKVDYINFRNHQLLQSFPLTREFIFKNIYATYKGDRLSTDDNYYSYFDRSPIPFSSSEQIIYDIGVDLKLKLKIYNHPKQLYKLILLRLCYFIKLLNN